MRLLAVSDEVDEGLACDAGPAAGAGLIVACGDLPFDYLAYLMDALDAPLVFVPGNHDPDLSGYRVARSGLTLRAGLPAREPWPSGAVNADGRVIDVAGLRIAGLGGSIRYRDGPNQYTEREQARRARMVRVRAGWRRWRDRLPVDVVLTHAPPRDAGDADDPPHRGFASYHRLIRALAPAALLHGHVHPYGHPMQDRTLGTTRVCNVVGSHLFEVSTRPEGVYTGTHASFHRLGQG